MPGLVDRHGCPVLSPDVHRRMCAAVEQLSVPFGDPVHRMIRAALRNGRPLAGDRQATMAYFGADLPLIQTLIKPLVEAINGILPGFGAWLRASRFGDDKDFVLALLEWVRAVTEVAPMRGSERSGVARTIASDLRASTAIASQASRSETS